MATQMAEGRLRPMHPVMALQSFIGPIFFHLVSRPALERIVPVPMSPKDAVAELVAVSVVGLRA